MIKAIIFDAGGVIVDLKPLLDRFIEIFNPKNVDEFWHEINIEAIPLCKNMISEEQYWKKIAKLNKMPVKKVPKDLWTRDFARLTSIDKNMVNLIKKLKSLYKIGMISNSIESHARVNRKRGLFDDFDVVVLSHKVNLAKDSIKIFLLAAKKIHVKPEECVFIDDVKDFVDMAESANMKGIVFKDYKQLLGDLERILKHGL